MIAVDGGSDTVPVRSYALEEEGVDFIHFVLREFWEVDAAKGPRFYIADGEIAGVERDECPMWEVLGGDRDALRVFGPIAPAQRSVGVFVLV